MRRVVESEVARTGLSAQQVYRDLEGQTACMQSRDTLMDQLRRLQGLTSDENLALFNDYHARLDVMLEMRYVDRDHVVQLKGRVACEINTSDELLLTELIFSNIMDSLDVAETVALLSAFVFQKKTQDGQELPPRLITAKKQVTELARDIGKLQIQMGVDQDVQEYMAEALNFGLLEVVYEWARGKPFKQICTLTMVEEGIIVRTISRLDEVCREVRNSARIIGEPRLYRKMESASDCIKRDIIFATSLYLE